VICRLRARVPVYLSAGLMLLAVSMAVDAAPDAMPPLTWADISLAIWLRYGAAVATSIAATWVLLAGYERRQDARHADTMKALATAADRLRIHNDDAGAHLTASQHNHGPMNEQADRVEQKLDDLAMALHDLIRDHNRIQQTEGAVCEALHELRRRNPADSPHTRREGDSRDDYTPLRGPK